MALPDFTPKDWKDTPSTDTPLSAAALEDQEARLSDHATASAQEAINQAAAALTTHSSDTTGVHGIPDTSQLALKSETTAAIATAEAYTNTAVNDEAVTRAAQDALKAPLASPALTGNPTAPTQAEGNNSTRIATTEYADRAVNTLAGTVVRTAQNLADVADAGASRANLHVQPLAACAAVVTSNVSLSGTPTIDGVALSAGDRVLLTAQSSASQNGPWVVASGSWSRPTDYPNGSTVRSRSVLIAGGTNFGGSTWQTASASTRTVGTDGTSWTNVDGRYATTTAVWPLERFSPNGRIVPGNDHTEILQAACDAARDAAIAGTGATILCPPGIELRVGSSIAVRGTVTIDLNGSRLRSTAATNTAPVFVADPDFGANLFLRNGRAIVSNTLIRGRGTPGFAGALFLTAEQLVVTAADDLNAHDAFDFISVDRMTLRNIVVYGANHALRIEGSSTLSPTPNRGNTQLVVENFFVVQCRAGAILRNVDKMRLNMDCSNVGAGIILASENHRIDLERSHVELFGNPTYAYTDTPSLDGYAFALNAASVQRDNTWREARVTLPLANAKAGFGTYGTYDPSADAPNLLFEHCSATADQSIAAYRPVDLTGCSWRWVGRWPYVSGDNIRAGGGKFSDGVVVPTGPVPSTSGNLLPFTRISSSDDLAGTSGGGSFAVSAPVTSSVPHSRVLTLTGTINRWRSVVLRAGWHTLVINGYSNVDDFFVYVGESGGSFADLVSGQLRTRDTQSGQLMRRPFFVATDGTYRFGVKSFGSGGAGIVGRVGVFRGLVDAHHGDPTVSRLSAAPSGGIYDVGDQVWNTAPAAGGAPGWVCTNATGPVFKAMANLAA